MNNKYEMELNLNEQRMALKSLEQSINNSIKGVERKRNMRESEKAMSTYSLKTKLTAVLMAVDRIDEVLKIQNAR